MTPARPLACPFCGAAPKTIKTDIGIVMCPTKDCAIGGLFMRLDRWGVRAGADREAELKAGTLLKRFAEAQVAQNEQKHADSDCSWCDLARAYLAGRDALEQAEACMSIVEPRSDKAEYLRILGVIRAALSPQEQDDGETK